MSDYDVAFEKKLTDAISVAIMTATVLHRGNYASPQRAEFVEACLRSAVAFSLVPDDRPAEGRYRFSAEDLCRRMRDLMGEVVGHVSAAASRRA